MAAATTPMTVPDPEACAVVQCELRRRTVPARPRPGASGPFHGWHVMIIDGLARDALAPAAATACVWLRGASSTCVLGRSTHQHRPSDTCPDTLHAAECV